MAKPAPGHAYDISGLNVVFGISSIVLFVTTIWMIWDDYSREWKQYQRQFFQMEREMTAEQIQEADAAVNQRELQRLQTELQAATEELDLKQTEISELEATLGTLNEKWTFADIEERTLKAIYDSEKFFYDDGVAGRSVPIGKRMTQEDFEARAAEFLGARDARIAVEYERDTTEQAIRDTQARVSELNGERDALVQTATLLRRKAAAIAQNVPNTFRNLPMVDFIDPSIEVQQVLVRNVTEDLNFAKVPRIDRCKTCHLGIDNPDYADAEQPFSTHPDLDLYVGAESVHPRDDFGCTSMLGSMKSNIGRFRNVFGTFCAIAAALRRSSVAVCTRASRSALSSVTRA